MPTKKPKTPKFYTITEAAKKLKVSRSAVHEAIQKGRLEAERGKIEVVQIQITRGWKILAKSLHEYQVSRSHQERGKKT